MGWKSTLGLAAVVAGATLAGIEVGEKKIRNTHAVIPLDQEPFRSITRQGVSPEEIKYTVEEILLPDIGRATVIKINKEREPIFYICTNPEFDDRRAKIGFVCPDFKAMRPVRQFGETMESDGKFKMPEPEPPVAAENIPPPPVAPPIEVAPARPGEKPDVKPGASAKPGPKL